MKTITLIDLRSVSSQPDSAFRVKSLTNSITKKIGDYLSEKDVEFFLAEKDWKVNVVGRD